MEKIWMRWASVGDWDQKITYKP